MVGINYQELKSFMGIDGQVKIGDKVWICDYRYNDVQEKAIRHVAPQEVAIVSNEDLPKNKTVYYSDIHFRPIGKKGNTLARIIAPYDNTGYRSYTGVSINIFLTKEDCINHYLKQCEEIKELIVFEKERAIEKLNKLLKEVDQEIVKITK